MMDPQPWPELPYADWKATYETLHLYTQVVGKVKLALAPRLNEWWHAAYHLWARGITTGPIPYHSNLFEIRFDLISHTVEMLDSRGATQTLELSPRTVAEFYHLLFTKLDAMGIQVQIAPAPQEMPEDPIPLDQDTVHSAYDREQVARFWHVLSHVTESFERFRSGFLGKASPVHFWWGSFDLNITRFSGKLCAAPPKAGHLARVDCDEEHFSAGFWPGSEQFPEPAFYSYGYPSPVGLESHPIPVEGAGWNSAMGEFILPYNTLRAATRPEEEIMRFLASAYEAVATLGKWDRSLLERKAE